METEAGTGARNGIPSGTGDHSRKNSGVKVDMGCSEHVHNGSTGNQGKRRETNADYHKQYIIS